MSELDEIETFVTIDDMTYIREVTETDYKCMSLYFQFYSICVFSELV